VKCAPEQKVAVRVDVLKVGVIRCRDRHNGAVSANKAPPSDHVVDGLGGAVRRIETTVQMGWQETVVSVEERNRIEPLASCEQRADRPWCIAIIPVRAVESEVTDSLMIDPILRATVSDE
jgi:hypothetical protein